MLNKPTTIQPFAVYWTLYSKLCTLIVDIHATVLRRETQKWETVDEKVQRDQKQCKAQEHKERVEDWLATISCIWAKTEIKAKKCRL